jgi:hypothetical protein
MKTKKLNKSGKESTYSMLVASGEKRRTYFETIVYAVVMVSAIVAILQFSLAPDPLPMTTLPG